MYFLFIISVQIMKPRGALIEEKIELLESYAEKISNRRSRRWLNDRLLIELVPPLDAEEIRGLFAPPPWGDNVPKSPFCMTNLGEWDTFRSIDMDKEARIIEALQSSSTKTKRHVHDEKIAALNAWHRVDCRTRAALKRSFLSELIESFEDSIRSFLKGTGEEDMLVFQVQDPFHRMILHGVCEFYDLTSVTITRSMDDKPSRITKIRKKKSGSAEPPNVTLSHFLKMSKEGIW
ncbi:hypothetical protein Scep_009328 [Stephania cephalantha]|uniref:R3H domain-containing protein n=1 Tax=Stephania cephalantha TaxID=152367 RepID=A0AAP0JT22_9MAGN